MTLKHEVGIILIEDFTAYDKSIRWSLQDAYFARRGQEAWLEGDMPFFGLNNPVVVKQHARLLLALVAELQQAGQLSADGPVYVLEVGAGHGLFAEYLFHALQTGPPLARKLAERLVFVLSDSSAKNMQQAMERPALSQLHKSGQLVPAILDLRTADRLTDLQGNPWNQPFIAIFLNYVACVTPIKILRKSGKNYFERFVKVEADASLDDLFEKAALPTLFEQLKLSFEWRPVRLASLFESALHAQAIQALARPFYEATILYPYVFFDALQGLARLALPGALALVNDFGSSSKADLAGIADVNPEHYGNTLAHEVHLAVLEAYCKEAGFALARIREPFRSIQTAAIRFQRSISDSFKAAFARLYERQNPGEDMIDFSEAAFHLFEQGQYRLAVRLYQRCLAYAPDDAELHFRLGRSCLESGHPYEALHYLKQGANLPGCEEYKFDEYIAKAQKAWRFRRGDA